jgi:HSP20 family protein
MKRRPLGSDPDALQSEIERLFGVPSTARRWIVLRHSHVWQPPTDVFETEDVIVVQVEIAGMRSSEFTISLSDRVLSIGGARHDPAPKTSYLQMEIPYGDFHTEVFIAAPVIEDAIQATYHDGFLKVVLPKAKTRRVRILDVSTDETDPTEKRD